MAENENEFFKQYRRPEWQKKRLEVMEAAAFKCQDCGAADQTLNVHHSRYVRDRKPWEYPDHELRCLCEGCHERRHEALEVIRVLLGLCRPRSLRLVEGYLHGRLLLEGYTNAEFSGCGHEYQWGFAAAWGHTTHVVEQMKGACDVAGRLTWVAAENAVHAAGDPYQVILRAAEELNCIKEEHYRQARAEAEAHQAARAAGQPTTEGT